MWACTLVTHRTRRRPSPSHTWARPLSAGQPVELGRAPPADRHPRVRPTVGATARDDRRVTSSPVPQPTPAPPLPTPMSKKTIVGVGAAILAITAAAVTLLWWAGTAGLDGDQLVTARMTALRNGLGIGLGLTGAFGIYLAWRRQHSTEVGLHQKAKDQADVALAYQLQREAFETTREHQRRVAEDTARDAEARRITDLYTKAVEQLGSDKAPVRLGGLYALERLAQDHQDQRQTIVNVICAYLRMPFSFVDPPGEREEATDLADWKAREAEYNQVTQEAEVRQAAQRLVAAHLIRPAPDDKHSNPTPHTYWSGIEIDLTGASLYNFSLAGCTIHKATFTRTVFMGVTRFRGTTFTTDTSFDSTEFLGPVSFRDAQFHHDANFDDTKFRKICSFKETEFRRESRFYKISNLDRLDFAGATFTATVEFTGGFDGPLRFEACNFDGSAIFSDSFHGMIHFRRTHFRKDASFNRGRFTQDMFFEGVKFEDDVDFSLAHFSSHALFTWSTFSKSPRFHRTMFNIAPHFDSVTAPSLNLRAARLPSDVPDEIAPSRMTSGRKPTTEAGDTAVGEADVALIDSAGDEPSDPPPI